MRSRIAVLEYGAGNVRSVCKAIERTDSRVVLSDKINVSDFSALVIPGVGAFGHCMQKLLSHHGGQTIQNFYNSGKPILGICVGLQILFSGSDELGEYTKGLGYFPESVTRLESVRLPHMGWNTVNWNKETILGRGLDNQAAVYFVHSYCVRHEDYHESARQKKVSWTHHEENFFAAVESDHVMATQFHPEKSSAVGHAILCNWKKFVDAS